MGFGNLVMIGVLVILPMVIGLSLFLAKEAWWQLLGGIEPRSVSSDFMLDIAGIIAIILGIIFGFSMLVGLIPL